MSNEASISREELEHDSGRSYSFIDRVKVALARRGFDPEAPWTITERFDALEYDITHARGRRQ